MNVDTKVMMIRTWTLSDDYCSTVAVGFLDALASLDLKLFYALVSDRKVGGGEINA